MKPALRIIVLLLLALPLLMSADDPGQIREAHREAARKFLDNFEKGTKLTGTVEQNGSEGTFVAYFFGDEWMVRDTFGSLTGFHATTPEGTWSGSNYGVTYQVEPNDDPAGTVMDLLGSGAYLDDPYWEHFKYIGEDAGGFTFKFSPPGLPEVDVVLYSDPEEPEYLQLMTTQIAFCALDPKSIRHRSYYYYAADDQGRLYTKRETGRDIDQTGATVDFSDYQVTQVEQLSARPAELDFSRERVPVGGVSNTLTAPVEIPADTSVGYFIIPVQFPGSDTVFRFMLDTGASISLMNKSAATAAGLTKDITAMAHGHGSRAELQMGLCPKAMLGEAGGPQAPIASFAATEIPESNKDLLDALASYDTAGILGLTVFEQYVVKLDHPGGKLILFPPTIFNADKDVPRPNIAFWLDCEDLLFCKARLADQIEGEVVIDTGLQQELALLGETLDINNIKLEKVAERNNTVLGGVKKFDYVKVPSFELGPLRMEGKIASITDDDRGTYVARGLLGFIGLALFQDGPVWIDVFQQRMYLEPPGNLGYFPGLTPPPGDKKDDTDDKSGQPKDKEAEKTKLPINIGLGEGRLAG